MPATKPTICFDLDGVLCQPTNGDYGKAQPIVPAVRAVNRLYRQGYRIIIHTSRFMSRNHGDILGAYRDGYEFTRAQLAGWGVRYHALFMGKPIYDIVIDDRSLFYRADWACGAVAPARARRVGAPMRGRTASRQLRTR